MSTSDKWWMYLADYDGKPGSTRVDMGLRARAPLPDLQQIVIFGTKYEQIPTSGFPTDAALEQLNRDSDSLILAVLSVQAGVYVGTFTHAGEQLHYVYVKSSEGTEGAFSAALAAACPTCAPIFRTRSDPEWKAYLKFLYPNEATLRHYGYDDRRFRSVQ
ncbi:MAG: DUF695 domain-containing protein [Pseudomonadota bacterium]